MFEYLFILKKTIGFLLMPYGLILLIGCIGWYIGKYKIALMGTMTAMILFSSGFIAQWAIQSLEQPFWTPLPKKRPCVVHVLGHAHKNLMIDDPVLALSQVALARLTVGLRELSRSKSHDGCALIVSGGQSATGVAHGQVMADAARALGYEGQLVVLPTANDTVEEALALKALGRFNQVSLVTSAMHMQRARAIFMYHGFDVVAVPADFESNIGDSYGLSLGNLRRLTLAWHEYLGRLWFVLTSTLANFFDEEPLLGRDR